MMGNNTWAQTLSLFAWNRSQKTFKEIPVELNYSDYIRFISTIGIVALQLMKTSWIRLSGKLISCSNYVSRLHNSGNTAKSHTN
jgi:hypothetical protein